MPTKSSPKSKNVVLIDTVVLGGGGAAMVKLTVAVCVFVLEDAARTMCTTPGVACGEAEISICRTAPGEREKALGEAVTPAGRPVTFTATLSLKLLPVSTPTTNAFAEPPAAKVRVDAEVLREKVAGSLSLPHPDSIATQTTRKIDKKMVFKLCHAPELGGICSCRANHA